MSSATRKLRSVDFVILLALFIPIATILGVSVWHTNKYIISEGSMDTSESITLDICSSLTFLTLCTIVLNYLQRWLFRRPQLCEKAIESIEPEVQLISYFSGTEDAKRVNYALWVVSFIFFGHVVAIACTFAIFCTIIEKREGEQYVTGIIMTIISTSVSFGLLVFIGKRMIIKLVDNELSLDNAHIDSSFDHLEAGAKQLVDTALAPGNERAALVTVVSSMYELLEGQLKYRNEKSFRNSMDAIADVEVEIAYIARLRWILDMRKSSLVSSFTRYSYILPSTKRYHAFLWSFSEYV